jgi:hypothetical protein
VQETKERRFGIAEEKTAIEKSPLFDVESLLLRNRGESA